MNENCNEMKEYIVFSMRLAGYLMLKGCKLVNIEPDKRNPDKWVYLFPYNEYVLNLVEGYKENRKLIK